jgi:RND family efflux transporter MFP subunit
MEEARTLLAYSSICAPFDGVVTRRFVQRGDLAVPGRALIEVENQGALRLEAQVPESLVGRLSLGDLIEVRVDAAGKSLQGKITEIAPASDPASRTTLVKIDLAHAEGLRSGQFGRARIPSTSTPRIRLPESAVFSRGQLDFVYVNDAGVARLRIVRTGRKSDGRVEILSGLEPGEEVVADPAVVPRDDTPLIVKSR